MLDQASQHAIALAKDRGQTEVGTDELLLGSLLAISRFGVSLLGPLVIELEELGVEWMTPPQERAKVAYSQAAVAVFDRAARIARAEGGGRLDIEHLLAAFAQEDTGLMGKLKGQLGISGAHWRAAVAQFAVARLQTRPPTPPAEASAAPEKTREAAPLRREFLTPEEAAEVLGIHVQTLRGYVRSGKLVALRLAGERALRIRRADLEALLEPLPAS